MKKFIIFLAAWFCLSGTAFPVTYKTVMKDSAGTMDAAGGVSAWVTKSGVTIIQFDPTAGVSAFFSVANILQLNVPAGSGVSQVGASTIGYISYYSSSNTLSGASSISGASITDSTITDDKIIGTLTKGIATTNTITARSKHINLPLGVYSTLPLSAVSGVFISAVSDASVAPTSGASCVFASPDAAGYDAVFILENNTTTGTTIYVAFTAGDNIISSDTITAGVSKYILSGTTDAQMLWVHSTGVSKWFVRGAGSPTVGWD